MVRYALDLDYKEWHDVVEKSLSEPKFRADQICEWIWKKHADNAEAMTNLSKQLRESLAEKFTFSYPELVKEEKSRDGTKKFLWRMSDGATVESVLMKYGDRLTACISTQVGCPLRCVFCATGMSGFVRNLSSGEIAGQLLAIEKHIARPVNNVVYMGMGEPFLNTDAVLKSVRLLNNEKMRGLGIRHITISTSGVVPGIEALAKSGLGVRLAVSIHSADDDVRSTIMPINNTYPLEELRKSLQDYQSVTDDRITIEYALFGGVNDSVEAARLLVRWLKGIHVFVNLIPANSVEARFEKPSPENIMKFRKILETAGFETEIRAEQGADINAACGQLRRKSETGEALPLEKSPLPKPKPVKPETNTHVSEKSFGRKYDKSSRKPADGRRSAQERTASERPASRRTTSGGFVEDAQHRHEYHESRKKSLPPKERYRSGKMKEERPSYKSKENAEKKPTGAFAKFYKGQPKRKG